MSTVIQHRIPDSFQEETPVTTHAPGTASAQHNTHGNEHIAKAHETASSAVSRLTTTPAAEGLAGEGLAKTIVHPHGSASAGQEDNGPDHAPPVQVEGLEVSLPNGQVLVSDIHFSIGRGETVALVGESGSGKTTVAMALMGYARDGARISAGRIQIAGQDIRQLTPEALRAARGHLVCHVAQNPAMALNPLLRLGTHLHDVLQAHLPELDTAARDARIRDTLADVGLPVDPAFLQRFPHQLSGGQQQRVMLALAFILKPRLIVLDEPTTALDVTTQARILATLKRLCSAQGVSALYVSHDLALVRQIAQRVIVLYAGRIIETAPAEQFFAHPAHPYSHGLLAAIPDIASASRPRPIPGRPVAPDQRLHGCAYSPRCSQASTLCRQTLPPQQVRVHLVAEHGAPLAAETHQFACFHPMADGVGESTTAVDRALPATREPAGERVTDNPAHAEGIPLLQVRGIFAAYARQQVLFDVQIRVAAGECLAIVGESGSGKTTLARTIAGLGQNIRGELRYQGDLLPIMAGDRSATARRQIQYIFQNPYQALNPRLTIGTTLARAWRHFFASSTEDETDVLVRVLQQVALSPTVLQQYPSSLSGGELQRVAIARALLCQPRLLICDEITSALDVSVQASILELLAELQQQGLGIVFVTHNLGVVRAIADRVVVLQRGLVVEDRPADALFSHPEADYTRALLADSPSLLRPRATA